MRRQQWLVAVLALGLCGCQVLGYLSPKFLVPMNRKEAVTEQTEAFATNLRWGRYDAAAAHVEPQQRIEFLKLVRDPRAPVRFTDWEVLAVELGPGMTEATALVHFKLHRLPSMTEIEIADEQTWRYEASRLRWFLVPKLAAYRDAGKPLARR